VITDNVKMNRWKDKIAHHYNK